MQLKDFDYELPEHLIARYPLPERSQSRLLRLHGQTGQITHQVFSEVVDLIKPEDLLVCNHTKVMPARLFGKKSTGGAIEILIERILTDHTCLAHVRASKAPKPGSILQCGDIAFTVVNKDNELYQLLSEDSRTIYEVIESYGEIPLPVYFKRSPEGIDRERYQTIYAKHQGSVAAPTAGLHFDEEIFEKLRAKQVGIDFVTLHVGAGTFKPVRSDNITEHKMHAEYAEVSESLCERIRQTKSQGGRVIAVGTTTARSLETACLTGKMQPFRGDTDIFIYPGFQFQCVDVLITNFHLPCSTLLMLVSAFGGREHVLHAYQEAIAQGYRFYSYGDAMWIERKTGV